MARVFYDNEIKNKANKLRKSGLSILEIANILHIAKSTASLWTKNVVLTEHQRSKLSKRQGLTSRATANAIYFEKKRLNAQAIGRRRILQESKLYVAGCMLYWGEGSKSTNQAILCNSDVNMIKLFVKFIKNFFNVLDSDIAISINAYTDMHSENEIKEYWLSELNLPCYTLCKCTFNNVPKSSKKLKAGKSEYGTCRVRIRKSTLIVQEIYGAIQEFGSFSNPIWLNKGKMFETAGVVY